MRLSFCGDSRRGRTQAQIATVHWDTSKPSLPLFRQLVKDRVAEVMKGRTEIQAAPDDTARAIQEARHRSLETRLRDIRLMGDAVIAAFFAEEKPKAREKKRTEVESWLTGSMEAAWDKLAATAATLKQSAHPLTPFHWEIEFPEVFAQANGGFDAIIGNPPFLAGRSVWPTFGGAYRDFLREIYEETGGKAVDLVAYFFRRAFSLVRDGGAFGLIATNTIGQGDTRMAGLSYIRRHHGWIFAAIKRMKWPGEAAVHVSVVHIKKGEPPNHYLLSGKSVPGISSFLVGSAQEADPRQLRSNSGQSLRGHVVLGMGFTFDDRSASGVASPLSLMDQLIKSDPRNAIRIVPYMGGEEINSSPTQMHHRYVINFAEMSEAEACQWPDLMEIVRAKVRPERVKLGGYSVAERRSERWWQFGTYAAALQKALRPLRRCLVLSQVSAHHSVAFQPTDRFFVQTVVVFPFESDSAFAALQSRIHEMWARFFGSSMKDDLRYTPSDCFETFPFPPNFKSSSALEAAGRAYHDHRAALMIARNEGLTKTYNRFHDRSEVAEDIRRLRELHAAMDRAVLEAYGWHDLAARAAPIFLDETNEDDHTYQGRLFWPSDFRDEVLAHLLALNAERHAEEIRLGIAPGIKRKVEEEGDEGDSIE